MNDESDRLRAAIRTQEAVLRAVTDELTRETRLPEGLRDQADAESARLVSAMESLSQSRAQPLGSARCPPIRRRPEKGGRRSRVLVVDDDEAARIAIASWLGRDYDVVTARDGAEGLERAQETPPDAVIADVSMPRMDGISMAHQIRALLAPALVVPVLFLTAHSAPESVTDGFSAGGVAYLVKPVDLDLLDHELRCALSLRSL